jgi:hypothetical protein
MLTLDELKKEFTGAPEGFLKLTMDELKLCSEKNTDYAKGGDPLGHFHRVSKILELYPNLDLKDPTVVAIIYALKQFDAAVWMLNKRYEGKVENVDARLTDVHVYMKLARMLNKERTKLSINLVPDAEAQKT